MRGDKQNETQNALATIVEEVATYDTDVIDLHFFKVPLPCLVKVRITHSHYNFL